MHQKGGQPHERSIQRRPGKAYAGQLLRVAIRWRRGGEKAPEAPGRRRGGVVLPYQKSGDDRQPIEAVRTLSVPQMIDGRARETIEQTINTKLGERFNHHIERAMR